MNVQVVVPAAGRGVRLGSDGPKALISLGGKPLLAYTLERFRLLGLLETVIIVVSEDQHGLFKNALGSAFPGIQFRLAPGGPERQISVSNGLACLESDTEIVAIHDAARPFVAQESILASIEAAKRWGASTVAVPSVDTILHADGDAYLLETPDRSRIWACQTPQTFQVDVIRRAHEWARTRNYMGTDDATLVREMGERVKIVMGSSLNFKITTPTDLALAQCVIREGLCG